MSTTPWEPVDKRKQVGWAKFGPDLVNEREPIVLWLECNQGAPIGFIDHPPSEATYVTVTSWDGCRKSGIWYDPDHVIITRLGA